MKEQFNNVDNGQTPIGQPIDIIWNLTLVCPWDCKICCVDAVHVTKKNETIQILSEGLTKKEEVRFTPGNGSIFDQAAAFRQAKGAELNFNEKLAVLHHLDGYRVKLDFSGGDVLTVAENYALLKAASKKLGKERITLTATGAGLARWNVAQIAPYISEINFTYDGTDMQPCDNRPGGYAAGNLKKAAQFSAAGVLTRAECPLTTENISRDTLENIFMNLHHNNIKKLLLMRLFPVGRGELKVSDIPTPAQYGETIAFLHELEAKYAFPKIKLQCALKHFDNPETSINPCDLFRESFGLTPDGRLLASPWAINRFGQPLNDIWVLGNLAKQSLGEILSSEKAAMYRGRLDHNFGHCKIFSYLNSGKSDPADRIFDLTDPLYQ